MGSLSPLKNSRILGASTLLSSKKAFCFCEMGEDFIDLKLIESIQMESEEEWKLLQFDSKVERARQLAAVSFLGSIIVFGGTSQRVCRSLLKKESLFRISHSPKTPKPQNPE